MAHLLDGRALALKIRGELKEKIARLPKPPRLAVILVGEDPASELYVSLKQKAAAEVGLAFEKITYPEDVSPENLLKTIADLNARPEIDAMIVQLPLPAELDEDEIIAAIDPAKDADGFHPKNIEALRADQSDSPPGLVEGITELVKLSGRNFQNERALILANSATFAEPLALALKKLGLEPETVIGKKTEEEIAAQLAASRVIVAAWGEAEIISGRYVKDGTVLVDVGTTRLPDGKVRGDVRAADFLEREVWLTPVPGGVGPMTVAMLLKRAFELGTRS